MGTLETTADLGRDVDLRLSRLRRFNLLMGFLHLGQGIAMLLLANDFALPVKSSFLRFDAGRDRLLPDPETLFRVRVGPLVAAFLFLSAVAHLVLASLGYKWYRRNLLKGINPARWIEYSASSSLMIVVIAMLVGIYDIAALIVLFALNACMVLFGWMMELHNQTTVRTNWTSYWFGVFAGAVPWVAIGLHLFGAHSSPPTFVYWIYGSIFVFFNVFAMNMVLQYRKVGRWRDYLYGERAYVILSLVAKSLLAWQVFAGTLRPA
ncbi:MAG: heliorhodopsin HeR [Actinomycetota bacterium]